MPGRFGVRAGGDGTGGSEAFAFVSEMKKCALSNNGPAETSSKLVLDQRIARVPAEVVEPFIGVESCIAMLFVNAAVKFVCSGAG